MTVFAPAAQEAALPWSALALDLVQDMDLVPEDCLFPMTNDQRAARALLAIAPAYDSGTARDVIADVLTDIRHIADLMGWSFGELDREAHSTYTDEVLALPIAQNETLRAAIERDL